MGIPGGVGTPGGGGGGGGGGGTGPVAWGVVDCSDCLLDSEDSVLFFEKSPLEIVSSNSLIFDSKFAFSFINCSFLFAMFFNWLSKLLIFSSINCFFFSSNSLISSSSFLLSILVL